MPKALISHQDMKKPLNILSKKFAQNKYGYYEWLREHDPLHEGKLAVLKLRLISRYEDCLFVLKDKRFKRDLSNVRGKGGKMPFSLPRNIQLMTQNMVLTDDPEHRRLRNLVHQAFTPRALKQLESRIQDLTHELLDSMEGKMVVDLKADYALPIPVTVISEMLGVTQAEMTIFRQHLNVVVEGFSGWGIFKAVLKELPEVVAFLRKLIQRKRAAAQEDILSGLIHAQDDESEESQLSEDELVSMTLLLIVAGYETTVHLITNSLYCLIRYRDQLERLRTQPELIDSAIEEVLRFMTPIHGTKMYYPSEDIPLGDSLLKKGEPLMPLLGSANHDPRQFEQPEVFDIARSPNKHLGFSQGVHYCLGAPLARIEVKAAVLNFFERFPRARLAFDFEELQLMKLPTIHAYRRLPMLLD